jgi:surface antigen
MTPIASHLSRRAIFATLAAAIILATTAIGSYADPPGHAPAHGWRNKHDPYHTGYRGRRWPDDYGVLQGRCNRSAIGAVVGGSIGGAIGSAVGKGDDRLVAVVLGTAVGAVIGSEVGRRMDESDRGCFGHSLELAKTGQTIRWTNSRSGVDFAFTPLRDFERGGRDCREFETSTTREGIRRATRGKACRTVNGDWSAL